ncbi:PQQ-binding-like beta-propeller repeat protein [Streptomyces spiralis]|uniref:outer membrane protein assembly factor BamB family protein n=1 Tax=Streptomyces spiralis TaxID=66376 RepID=UPI0034115777
MAQLEALEPDDPRQVGRYRIVARLGAGGMGQVYLARSPGARPVAVKVVRPDLAQDGDFRRRFAREVNAARRVNGAFTAGVVDADPDGSPAWLATVYVPGVSLGEAVAAHGPWPARLVLALGAGLAEALEVIHRAGVVHRDLKPSNILLAADGPRVIDFGISVASEASALTHTGMTIGTPGFMSPEQLTGHPVGPASDVFSLGAVLAYTATGTGPFGTGTPHALHYRAVHEQPDLDALPDELREVVAACLAKQPDQRPTVAALLDRLTATGSADGESEADAATLLLTEPGWMPDPVARLVQANATTALPHTPPPAERQTPATPPAVTRLDPDVPATSASPQTPQPASPAAPAAHQEPTRTARQPAPETLGPSGTTPEPTDPEPSPHAQSAGPRPLISRRRALLAVTGTALAAGATLTTWKLLDNGTSGTHSDTDALGGAGTTPSPTRADPSPAETDPSTILNPNAGASEQRWAFHAGGSVSFRPTVASGVVYVGSNDNNLYALDTSTGKKRWVFPTEGKVQSSPVVADGVVYVGSEDNNVYAVDAGTGKQRWAFSTSGVVWSNPVATGGVVYVGSKDHNVYALDASTGKQRWVFPTDGEVTSSAAVVGGVVYIGSDDHNLYALDARTGKKRWNYPVNLTVHSTPMVVGGLVYFGCEDRYLYAIDAETGHLKTLFPADSPVQSSPLVVNGVVYVGSYGKHLYALDARTLDELWAFSTSGSVSTPTMADGVVYVGSYDKNLYAVDARTGKERWVFRGGNAMGDPVVAGGVVYIGSDDQNLYAVQT